MTEIEQLLKGLEFFKDWSNYLLVTTVAIFGWVAAKDHGFRNTCLHNSVIWSFAASAIFGIFTLALIPLVAEELTASTNSIFAVGARFRLFWLWGPECALPLKAVCWPQHLLFILGVLLYAIGRTWKPRE